MKTLLVIHSSARQTRSVTRHLTARFVETWHRHNPDSTLVVRDVGLSPPSPLHERWIAAAFDESGSQASDLVESEMLIDEIASADAIVMGVPMYNFGLPAQLKAYFDQVIRMGRTFAYDPHAAEPYRGLLSSRPCTIITSVSEPAMHPPGALSHLNFLEPHVNTMWSFIGISDIRYVRAEEGLLRDAERRSRFESEIDEAAKRS